MKLLEKIKEYDKLDVFRRYTKIVKEFKPYDKITKNNMLKEIIKVYSNYENIIDILTTRELKYLKKVIEKRENLEDLKYDFELKNLREKFLISDFSLEIPEEFLENVVLAVKKYDPEITKKCDIVNEVLVGICKIYGEILPEVLVQIASSLLNLTAKQFEYHLSNNLLFNYYVGFTNYDLHNEIEGVFVYNDYYECLEDLREQRKLHGRSFSGEIDLEAKVTLYKNFFYEDFNIENKKVKKLLDILKKNEFYKLFKDLLIRTVILNMDIEPFIDLSCSMLKLSDKESLEYKKLVRDAYMEIPIACFNGLTKKEAMALDEKEELFEQEKINNYHKQGDACLSKTSAKLFYKLYFALLDFTNKKYGINKKIEKIYKQEGLNPYDLADIIEKLWEDKNVIFPEFIYKNPYHLDKKELKLVKEMQKGIRDNFTIVGFEEEYTAVVYKDRVYMIKGINTNIDEVINIKSLPLIVKTTILPFKDCLIYDSLFFQYPVDMGLQFKELVMDEYNKFVKYYHL